MLPIRLWLSLASWLHTFCKSRLSIKHYLHTYHPIDSESILRHTNSRGWGARDCGTTAGGNWVTAEWGDQCNSVQLWTDVCMHTGTKYLISFKLRLKRSCVSLKSSISMHRICLLQYTESYNGIVPLFMHKSCVCHVPLTLHCRLQYMSAVRRRSNSIGLSDCCSDTGEWDVTRKLDNGSTCMNTHWTISPWIKAVSL